jgi:Na+-transporting NADH:ubiquinone oxidoreductase subunit D
MQDKEPLFSAKNLRLLTKPLNDQNPITVQTLGICSALAITVKLQPSVVMTISVMAVMGIANVVISLMRQYIPSSIRIIVELTIISTLVIIVDQILKAYAYEVSKQLSIFVGLIITNCIIMGRLESFATSNKPWPAFLDGIGNAAGYGLVLIIVGFARELLGSGEVWGYPVVEKLGLYDLGYADNKLMILPPMALITVGVIIWIQRYKNRKLIEP